LEIARNAFTQFTGGKFREGDRHQLRFIVAPADSAKLSDLKPFVRDLVRQMEQDLSTRLVSVAVDHFNTGHPA
jgi:type IV secretory pathway VirD2 relaxase